MNLKQFAAILLTLALALFAVPTNAQSINGMSTPITVSYNQGESISASVDTASLVLAVSGGNLKTTSSANVTVTWSLLPSRVTVEAQVDISGPLTGIGGHVIPQASEFAIIGGVTSSNSCLANQCGFNGLKGSFSGADVVFNQHPITNFTSSTTFTLGFQISGNSFPADTYSQTATIQVIAA